MAYIEGFVAAVPAANKEAYRKHAADAAVMLTECGVTRMVEAWGDDVPEGKVTDFRGAVKALQDEVVVFAWFEYPSKDARDAAHAKMKDHPRMKEMSAAMPFDGKRMIYGGFESIIDVGAGGAVGKVGYVDGSLVPVPAGSKAAYRELAARQTAVLKEHGATRVVDAWGDDIPDGKVTDYKRAVKATDDETVVFTWIEWPSKEARDTGWRKVFADPRMHPDPKTVPIDEQRRVHGGFAPILDV